MLVRLNKPYQVFMRFFTNMSKNFMLANVLGLASSYLDTIFLNKKYKSHPFKKDSDYQAKLQNKLKNLGVTKQVELLIADKDTSIIAGSAAAPFYNKALIILSPSEISYIHKNVAKEFSKDEVVSAILAHESVHINDNHKFKTIFGAALAYTMVFDLATILCMSNLKKFISSAFALKTTYILLSRHFEFEADAKAAKQDPKICRALSSVLKTIDPDEPSFLDFFDNHPSTRSRVERLEKISSEHSYRNF